MKINNPPTKTQGLSLIEILIAMLTFALIMGGFANLFFSTMNLTTHHRHRIVATEMARFFLDALQMDVRQDQWGSNCLSTDGIDTNCVITSQTRDGITYTPEYDKSSGIFGTTLRRVILTVDWTEPTL